LLALIILQFCSGIATVVFNWPLLIAVLHNAGAALMLLYLVMLNYRLSKDTLRRFGLTPITSSPA
jgi:cytochrome c oxidase assembly protein subunit 15